MPNLATDNPYQVIIDWVEDGIELTWEPQKGVDNLHGITGPILIPKEEELVLRPHEGGIHRYSPGTAKGNND